MKNIKNSKLDREKLEKRASFVVAVLAVVGTYLLMGYIFFVYPHSYANRLFFTISGALMMIVLTSILSMSGIFKDRRLRDIENGVVIDHITAGWGYIVLAIIRMKKKIPLKSGVITGCNSAKMGKKDVIKLEGVRIDPEQLNVIAVVAPKATVSNIVKGKVKKKYNVKLPNKITGVFECLNPDCVTHNEPVKNGFRITKTSRIKILEEGVSSKDPPELKCHYCEKDFPITRFIESMRVLGSPEIFKLVEDRLKIKKGSI